MNEVEMKNCCECSLGAGAVLLCNDTVLLVRRGKGVKKGWWAIPGGYVEPNELITDAVKRELFEETEVSADLVGLIGVRNRLIRKHDENSIYFIFLMKTDDPTIKIDNEEVIEAGFFSLDEVKELSDILPLCRLVVTEALEGKSKIIEYDTLPDFPDSEYIVFH